MNFFHGSYGIVGDTNRQFQLVAVGNGRQIELQEDLNLKEKEKAFGESGI